MSRVTLSSIAAILILCTGAVLFVPANWLLFAVAQEEAAQEERIAADRDDDVGPQELERRLDEIEKLIERAEQRDDDDRILQLRREGERLLDRLERFERDRRDIDDEERDEGELEEEEEWDRHVRELEIHRLELDTQRLQQELNAARQETSVRLAHIAEDKFTSASYAILQAIDQLDEEAAIDFLAELQQETENETVRRIIRHHLVTLNHHADRPDAARRELRALILSE